jgi:hypothetical protein
VSLTNPLDLDVATVTELTPKQELIKRLKYRRAIFQKMTPEQFKRELADLIKQLGLRKAARALQVPYATLYYWCDVYDIRSEPIPLEKATPQEVAWLAGLMEADGSMLLLKTTDDRKIFASPHIMFSGTDRTLVEPVALLIGSGIYVLKHAKEKRKPIFKAGRTGASALKVLKQIMPYMKGTKAARARWMLERFTLEKPRIFCGMAYEGLKRFKELVAEMPPAIRHEEFRSYEKEHEHIVY